MSEIEQLGSRLAAAMERIAVGVATLEAAQDIPDTSSEETAALQAALEEEKLANAQLQERVRKLSQQEAAPAASTERIEALDLELQRLRKATDELRASNAALREANAAGVGDPHLINKAMMAELEALRATRAADVAEADTILSALDSLLKGEIENA